jgi:hypothetical protein
LWGRPFIVDKSTGKTVAEMNCRHIVEETIRQICSAMRE